METLTHQIDYTKKEDVKTLVPTLDNIVKVSQSVFPLIEKARGKNLVLACGNTGCGKSTMITSLVFGPEMLEERKVKETRKLQDGREKQF